jgi:hypothetical protein
MFGLESASLGSLTAPGAGPVIDVSGNNLELTFAVTVVGVGTNVVVRLEGSLDEAHWFNLSADEEDITLTVNGTTGYNVTDTPLKAVRMRLVSFTGGSPTVSGVVASN